MATGKSTPVTGKRGTGAIVTILERKRRFYLVKKVTSKHAKSVAQATVEMLQPFKALVHSITADNDLEFADHDFMAANWTLTFISQVHTPVISAERTKTSTDCCLGLFSQT